MGARPVIVVAVAVGAVVLLATAAVRDGGPRPTSDSTAVSGRGATTAPAAVPTTAPAPTTTVAADSRPTAEAVGFEAYGGGAESPGLVITNSGSATASVGGNVVSGVPEGGAGVAVVTGDATAVGNSSSVRAP